MQIFTLLRSAGKTGAEIPPAPEKIKMKKTLEKSFRIQYNIVRCRKVRGNLISATVAQLVEQRIRNAQAVGSSPTSSSIWRVVREVEGAALEMLCGETHLGFESLTLRQRQKTGIKPVFCFS